MGFDITASILQLPKLRRKRKYVLFLSSSHRAQDTDAKILERVLGSVLPDYGVLKIENPDEALRTLVMKNVELVVLDSQFLTNLSLTVEYAAEIKTHKKCPILFLTTNENKLITAYREHMSLYEEMDDYLLSPVDSTEAMQRLKKITSVEARASKRFSVDIPVQLYRLNTDSILPGTLSDLSLVGFGLKINADPLLHREEQVQIRVSLKHFGIFHPQYGEIIKISGVVRRTSIEGTFVGCSIEHLTPMQNDCLVKVLERLALKMRATRSYKSIRLANEK